MENNTWNTFDTTWTKLAFPLIKDLDFALLWSMITYLSNKRKQVPSLHEVRLVSQVKQSKTLGLRYNTQSGHACDSMTKCNGHAWYDLMYTNEIC